MIPADIKLIESRDLFISQAVLTGEACRWRSTTPWAR
jgi:magnesium-transporting ATPase (P-type)